MEIDLRSSMEAPIVEMANMDENNGGNTDGNNDDLVNFEETQPNKRRRKKSIVWEHFTVESVGDGCTRAVCKQCKQTFSYSNGTKVAGTSHLKRHIALGVCPVIRRREKNQLSQYNTTSLSTVGTPGISTDPPQRRYRGTPFLASIPFDQERCRQEIAEMIIMHDYPLHMVEHSAFVSFVQNLQPHFNMGNFETIQGDIIAIYSREKQHLAKILSEIPGRISLALDLWISSQSVGYVFVMGYFIDNFWKLHRRVLNIVVVPSPYSGDALTHAIGVCLDDWGLNNKLCSITLDKGIWNDNETSFLRGFLSMKNQLILDGQFLIEHCYAHVLSSIALDGLEAMHDLINKVRESIKYVKTSQANEEKFFELKQQLQVPSMKSLSLDDQTQWNTTYLMLLSAIELKEVFSCLDTADADYKLAPTMDDWKQIETLCSYLKLLYDAASLLLDISTTTANQYFHEVWKIQLEFTHATTSEDQFVRSLTNPLKEKFDRYWKDCNLILAVAVVVDPRFKMKLVEFSFTKIYGDDASTYIKAVDDGIRELFSEYSIQPLMLTSGYVEVGNNAEDTSKTDLPQVSPKGTAANDRLMDFDVFISEMSTTQPMKSELDQYLEEALLARVQDFDILSWWKLNQIKFPTLSRMARDILSIPVSTVSPGTVFKTESNKLDQYRSSLRPETLEALVCAKDWHQSSLSTSSSYEVSTSNAIVKMEY